MIKSHKIWNGNNPNDPIKSGDGYVIHHINFNHDDDRPHNQMKLSITDHRKLHTIGKKHSEITKKKLSNHNKGNGNPFYNKKHTTESKKKISKNHADFKGKNHPLFGKHRSKETKQKISKANKGKLIGSKNPMYGVRVCGKDHHMFGKHHSIETRQKISNTLRQRNVL